MTPHQTTIGRRIVLILVCAALSGTTAYNRSIRSVRGDAHFAVEARGREAKRAAEWKLLLRAVESGSVGLISSAAFCGNELFLLDSQQALVHRIDLQTGRQTGHIGPLGKVPDEPRISRAMALDCAAQTLYMVDRTGVFVFNLASGRVENHFQQPTNFAYTTGSAVLDATTGTLFVPGLWTAARWPDWLHRDLDRQFQGDRLGYSLSLRDGTTTPLFTPLELGCWAYSSACLDVVFDEIQARGEEGWVVAQRVSTQVGVFDSQYRLLRVFDVRSPRFRENGRRMGHSSLADAQRWHEDNSTIRRVYAFGDHIVTIHTTHATKNWIPGQQIDFDVYMNIHSLDGTGEMSDIRLAGLPVARDDRGLYVLDYGPDGRRMGTDHLTLIRYPIVADGQLAH